MPVTASDVRYLYTVGTGPGGTFPQPSPADSHGGWASHTSWAGGVANDLFGPTEDPAITEYRCVFVANLHATDTLYSVRAWLASVPAAGADFLVGVDPAGVVLYAAAGRQAVRPAAGTTAPVGVVFSAPSDYAGGLVVGDLPAGYGRAVWFRRSAGTAPTAAVAEAELIVGGYPTDP